MLHLFEYKILFWDLYILLKIVLLKSQFKLLNAQVLTFLFYFSILFLMVRSITSPRSTLFRVQIW